MQWVDPGSSAKVGLTAALPAVWETAVLEV